MTEYIPEQFAIEISLHLRCPHCKKQTTGIEQFTHKLTGNLTKTCNMCRALVMLSYNQKPRIKLAPPLKKISMHDKLDAFNNIVRHYITKEQMDNMIADNYDHKRVLLKLFNNAS